jgi:cyd operon protein YbgT
VIEPKVMWYFPWILGLGPAATVGILNPLWYELGVVRETDETTAAPHVDALEHDPKSGEPHRKDPAPYAIWSLTAFLLKPAASSKKQVA